MDVHYIKTNLKKIFATIKETKKMDKVLKNRKRRSRFKQRRCKPKEIRKQLELEGNYVA